MLMNAWNYLSADTADIHLLISNQKEICSNISAFCNRVVDCYFLNSYISQIFKTLCHLMTAFNAATNIKWKMHILMAN